MDQNASPKNHFSVINIISDRRLAHCYSVSLSAVPVGIVELNSPLQCLQGPLKVKRCNTSGKILELKMLVGEF